MRYRFFGYSWQLMHCSCRRFSFHNHYVRNGNFFLCVHRIVALQLNKHIVEFFTRWVWPVAHDSKISYSNRMRIIGYDLHDLKTQLNITLKLCLYVLFRHRFVYSCIVLTIIITGLSIIYPYANAFALMLLGIPSTTFLASHLSRYNDRTHLLVSILLLITFQMR